MVLSAKGQSSENRLYASRSALFSLVGASLFTPARAGELARVACFPRRRSEVFTLVIVDKFIDMNPLLGVFLLSIMPLSPRMGWLGFSDWGVYG